MLLELCATVALLLPSMGASRESIDDLCQRLVDEAVASGEQGGVQFWDSAGTHP